MRELMSDSSFNYFEHHTNCKHLVRECRAVSIKEIAREFSLSKSTVRRHYDNGTLPLFKIANTVRGYRCWIGAVLRNPALMKNPAITLDSSTELKLKVSNE
jgi:hypothetical protein